MNVLTLSPISSVCDGTTSPQVVTVANPTMNYDSTLGGTTTGSTPITQGLHPPYPQLAAVCVEINGNGPIYAWNQNTATWKPT